jgi:hypothetical protein
VLRQEYEYRRKRSFNLRRAISKLKRCERRKRCGAIYAVRFRRILRVGKQLVEIYAGV